MALFFIGVIEMIISASWTKAVSKANIAMTGAITSINILIWYYVISVVVADLGNWHAIVPYTAGCALGAMLGAVDQRKLWTKARRFLVLSRERRLAPTDRLAGIAKSDLA